MTVLVIACFALVVVAAWILHEAREERLAGASERREALRVVERVNTEAHAERKELLDRLMHFAGKTWTLPPDVERAWDQATGGDEHEQEPWISETPENGLLESEISRARSL